MREINHCNLRLGLWFGFGHAPCKIEKNNTPSHLLHTVQCFRLPSPLIISRLKNVRLVFMLKNPHPFSGVDNTDTVWLQHPTKMAAPCMELLRSVAVRAYSFGSHQKFLCRRVHCSHSITLMCAKTEPHKTTEEPNKEQPEYIPKKKAKNPMMKIGYAWIIGLPSGIIGFILAKREVDKNRLKQLRIRQRMKRSNEGVYESDRFKTVQKIE
ncbi:hypothetical protein AAFF_G00308720 [Aldrovandia affinis]|uniref:Uncharacterized protein n=1 Tax=Aldrovandia affinis TaxID=143900 RepID=A0AAD7SNL7_9TELE|nr:hypothetical protein AAFF_G00308720 [Aldrovandia affinis]